MLKIEEAIVVEGNYDKVKLSSVVDTLIVTTDGFSIFKDKEKLAFLRTLAQKRGLIVLTDPDRAGFLIRNYIKQGIDPRNIKQAYIPDIYGKEKRKQQPGKEGKLGVEGVDIELIVRALEHAGATFLDSPTPIQGIDSPDSSAAQQRLVTKFDFYSDGLSGSPQSAQRRRDLAHRLGLPQRISANLLLDAINSLITYEQYRKLVDSLFG